MVIGSRQKRGFWANAAINGLPDIAIAAALAYFTDGAVSDFFLWYLVLQAMYFMVWLRRALWFWIRFWAGGRKQWAQAILDNVLSKGYPLPDDYINDADDYLKETMENATLPAETRLDAAMNLGAIIVSRQLFQVSLALQSQMAFEDALQEHKRSLPAKAKAQENPEGPSTWPNGRRLRREMLDEQ